MKQKIIFLLFLLSTISLNAQQLDNLDSKELFNLTLEELMHVKVVTGTLTRISLPKIPASVTVITSNDIEKTPARNIFDLIEIYVPSATFVNHWLGPRLCLHGVSGDQNSSFLILLNGIKTNTSYNGELLTEIQNKDLNDIDKIEIMRGSGSVTYGAGAIGGIINIITKSACVADGITLSFEGNLEYRYSNVSISYGFNSTAFKALVYGSINVSDGQKNPKFYYVDRAYGYGYGFMSDTWGNKGLGTAAPNFYENYWGKPEVKLYSEFSFFKELKFWNRYTTYNFTKQQQMSQTADGMDLPGLFGQQFISSLENDHKFNKSFSLKTLLGYTSQSHRCVTFYQGKNKPSDDITQRQYSYSENDIFLKSQANLNINDNIELALGGEYHYQSYGSEWGMDENAFILDFQSPIGFAVYDTTSGFYRQYGELFCSVIDKISTHNFSGFFEVNTNFLEKYTLLISGRLDKHEYSKWAFSPRIAFISVLNNKNIFKVILQNSVRLPVFRNLYSQQMISNTESKPEILKGIEFIYNRKENKCLDLACSGYYHQTDQIAWLPEGYAGLVGTFELFGFDAEVKYSINKANFGGNYSFVKQLSWSPESEIEAYIDVNLERGTDNIEKIYLADYGKNRINNMPSHMIKLFYNQSLLKNLSLHFDCRFYLDYQQQDMLNKFKDVHSNYSSWEAKNEMNAIYSSLQDYGYGKNSFTSNISVKWNLPIESADLSFMLYAMNFVSVNHIRYVYQYWEDGNLQQYPRQVGFIGEPVSVGAKCRIRF